MAGKSKEKGYPKLDKKTGRWFYVIEAGKDANGNRLRKKKTGFKTKSEAKVAMYAASLEVENNQNPVANSNKTLGEYLNYWLEKYA